MNITLCKIMSLIWEKDIHEATFCKDIGIGKSSVSEWKSGKTKSYTKYIDRIAKYFELPVSYFSDYLETPLDNTTHTIYDNSINRLSEEAYGIAALFNKADERDKETVRNVLGRYKEMELAPEPAAVDVMAKGEPEAG